MPIHITKDDIAAFRGEYPTECDFCAEKRDFSELEPEEAGQWVCHYCLRKWNLEDFARVKQLLSELYTPLDQAKWWFTRQPALNHRKPHWVMASGNVLALIRMLETIGNGAYQ